MSRSTRPAPSPAPSPRTRVRRLPERAHYDAATVAAIVDAAMICTVAFQIDGEVHAIPTIHWREGEHLYIHGAKASRMLKALTAGEACVTIALADGLVLARSAFNHSCNFRSAMIFGTAELVTDPAEKQAALLAITDRLLPGRNAELRLMSAQEIKATSVMRMQIETASAKVRDVNVGDDADDGSHPVWAGVIPIITTVGTPDPSPILPATTPLPAHLAPFVHGRRLDEALLETQAIYETPRL